MKRLRKKPAADTRSNGKWLWAAVTVGRGLEVFTHENEKKRFTFRFLPKKADAQQEKPRGFDEIRDTIKARIKPGSILVNDKWKSTVKAVESLGFKHAPPINHSVEFRDRVTGFHSNDIESENNRLKHWSRIRYGRLSLGELDLHEYSFYINVGRDMKTICRNLCTV